MQVPAGNTGTVGFYNEGFWGFNVDSAKRYIASMYVRGNYSGNVTCYFQSNATGVALASTNITLNQVASSGWKQTYSPTFMPTTSSSNANNTFYFTFDGKQLAGQSLYFNILSVFKQTYLNRYNGMREDLAESVQNLNAKWIRLPGGNNMEGNRSPYYWKWNQTIGDLTNRPGRPGTWGDINTDGFGLLEMMQASQDLDLSTVIGVWAGLYLDGEVIPQASLQPYVDSVMNELEFLTVSKSGTLGVVVAYFVREPHLPLTAHSVQALVSPIHLSWITLRLAMKIISTVAPTPTILIDLQHCTTPFELSIRA